MLSEQHPDPKRLINDDPAGSPSSEGSIKGYAEGQKDYAKGIDKGFDAQPEGGHTTDYKKGCKKRCKLIEASWFPHSYIAFLMESYVIALILRQI
jgi:hypothetical protein